MFDILIIEDQPAVREIIAEVVSLLNQPVTIKEVSTIKEAQPLIKQQAWSLIITDLSLGDGNSLDLIETLVKHGVHIPPIILVSGFLSAQHIRQAKSLHIKHILAKPFEPNVLLSHIEDVLTIQKKSKHTNYACDNTHRLLPEVFEMDRKLGLLLRMFDELPKQRDVTGVCNKALQLAMDMVHAQGGYIALFERRTEKLVQIVTHGLGNHAFTSNCLLQDTPFSPLIHANQEIIEVVDNSTHRQPPCWPNVVVDTYLGIPIYLQGIPIGVLCLVNRLNKKALQGESLHMLGLLVKKLDTLLDNRAVHAALADSMNQTLIALVRSLEARDRYTKDHSARVSHLAVLLAEMLDLNEENIQLIRTGGLLHDIGKVGIADAVLLKPGRYTDQEYAVMKAHPAIGDAILMNMDTLTRERLIVRHHHERWDGKGYPDKIGSTDIPFEARIVCVADAIDAMTTHRVYRQAKPLSFCAEQLSIGSGTQFDPQVVDVALEAIHQGKVNTLAKSNNDNERVLPIQASLAQELRDNLKQQHAGAHHYA